MQWLIGPVKSVFGKTGIFSHQIETEDLGVAVLSFKNGAVGTLIGTTCAYPGLETLVQVHGEHGSIYCDGLDIKAWKIAGDPQCQEETEVLEAYSTGIGSTDPKISGSSGHDRQIQDMIDSVRNHRPPAIPIQEARKAVEIIMAVYESSRTGKEIFL